MPTPAEDFRPVPRIARDLSLPAASVAAVVELLAEGNTVPFIARYRKERTGDLDEVQIRDIQERNTYLSELHDRRQTILASIEDQGLLNPELRAAILACDLKTELEDLYLPYKPRRRTRATKARELGLQPLADLILAQPRQGDPIAVANGLAALRDELTNADDALKGARDIVAEHVAETAEIRQRVREAFFKEGSVRSTLVKKKEAEAATYRDYFDFDQPVASIPSHRFLAIQRGHREGFLQLKVDIAPDHLVRGILRHLNHDPRSPYGAHLVESVEDAFKRLLTPSVENDVLSTLKDNADLTAIDVFAQNLRHLLLAAPAGARPVLAVDPGLRTGSKCVALSATGEFLDSVTLYLVQGDQSVARATKDLLGFVRRFEPFAIAVGNGTGGRETEAFVKKTLRDGKVEGVVVVSVNEAGASVYSASDVARHEFPDLDLTLRGAISIGRRFQDPLAEFVKIEPKALGVGQYQHDVDQKRLAGRLDQVVESCVNHVGVELNTASAPLLAYVAGIGPRIADRIVEYRDRIGGFKRRKQLLEVAGVGPRTFEQAAGFLRVRGAEHPLDASAVHPERYPLVERMARELDTPLSALVGDPVRVDRIDLRRYTSDEVGLPTLRDIVAELKKPGRDPRDTFEPPAFRDDVQEITDLRAGMDLEGVVTNVTAFGAFVDVGVHQDGLVHISQLADRFVKDPHEVVKAGQRIRVRVLEVDLKRKRISLTARSPQPPSPPRQQP